MIFNMFSFIFSSHLTHPAASVPLVSWVSAIPTPNPLLWANGCSTSLKFYYSLSGFLKLWSMSLVTLRSIFRDFLRTTLLEDPPYRKKSLKNPCWISFLRLCDKLPWRLKTTELYSLSSEGQKSKIQVAAGHVPSRGPRGGSFLASSNSWWL